jgi:hypothetical protein
MYRGAKGAEVAFLIRRLRARLGIHDRPDKLRVIATSPRSAKARRRSMRSSASPRTSPASAPRASRPSRARARCRRLPAPPRRTWPTRWPALDLDGINEALDAPALREKLAPLLPASPPRTPARTKCSRPCTRRLKNKPWVNQLVKEAAGHAVAVSELAPRVFPGHPEARRALEALLTVSTLARNKADEPGLVPTRVHGLFRGLHGLYACVNPHCGGRQSEPGEQALLGKLFTTPSAVCDACGCRVFEIASCRELRQPVPARLLAGGVARPALLPVGRDRGRAVPSAASADRSPRYTDRTEIVRLHLRTGYLDTDNSFPDDEVRSLALWLDSDGRREAVLRPLRHVPALGEREEPHPRLQDARRATIHGAHRGAVRRAAAAEEATRACRTRAQGAGVQRRPAEGRAPGARPRAQPRTRSVPAGRRARSPRASRGRACRRCSTCTRDRASVRAARLRPVPGSHADEVEFHNHLGQVKGKTLQQTLAMANRGGLRAASRSRRRSSASSPTATTRCQRSPSPRSRRTRTPPTSFR